MRVIVLGATGMLGSMVYGYLRNSTGLEVTGTSRNKEAGFLGLDVNEDYPAMQKKMKNCDYIINCIGITKPYCHDDNMEEVRNALLVNSLFPFKLSDLAKQNNTRVIQIATDCVYSGREGKYTEDALHDPLDVYGKTKSLGEVKSPHYLNIRSSIIGPEKVKKAFLFEWFMKQPKGAFLNGFSNHLWNGVTTLQFAKLCERIIKDNKFSYLAGISSVHHFVPNNIVSKYQMLCMFKDVFKREVVIKEERAGDGVVDRTLATKYNGISSFFPGSDLESEIYELKKYIEDTGFYNA
ncbi:MAG: SDR family oxidoreductase [Candidatus Omnitrophota bacterium]